MFEFSLENGKRQLKAGLAAMGICFVLGMLWLILSICVKNPVGILVFTIILGLLIAIFGLFGAITLIFGIVVYHAERTSARNTKDIVADNVEWTRLDGIKQRMTDKTIKEVKTIKSPIAHVYYSKEDDEIMFKLANNNCYSIVGVNDRVAKWQKLSKAELTKLFYDKLIYEAELEK